ncbi:MAG: hypothetical protein COA42_08740 [Alteromonadaceae bacterium]|nr:MAG: hypothetical protein COA42_08740 [Alteromonadaceae bacterium]
MFNWTPYLNNENDTVQSQELEAGKAYLCPLTEYQLLTITGPDAIKFLQGQCTCDFAKLALNTLTLGTHCSPKGRAIWSFTAALLAPDTIGLRVHQSMAKIAEAAIKKYILFSKATLKVEADYALLAIYNLPTSVYQNEQILQHKNSELSGNIQELWLTEEAFSAQWDALSPLTQVCSAGATAALAISAGLAEIRPETTEVFLPQELNYHFLGGVAFDKGCYTGQEIIARLHYKGQLKKQAYLGQVKCETPPQPGNKIYAETNQQSAVGTIINCGKIDINHYLILALYKAERHQNNDPAFINQNTSSKVEWLTLPYAIN